MSRALWQVSPVTTTNIELGSFRKIRAGQTVTVYARESVVTATLLCALGAVSFGEGSVPLEAGTDRLPIPDSWYAQFTTLVDADLTLTAGGTVAGLRTCVKID